MVCALVRSDIAVVGGGPAGWAAAVSFAEAGLQTILVAPDPKAPWPNNYGSWWDELPDADVVSERVWPRVEVRLDAHRVHVLDRPYVRVDNARLQQRNHERASKAGLRIVRDSVESQKHDRYGSTLGLASGAELAAVLVVDATGHRPRLARTGVGRPPGMQVAYGVEAQLLKGSLDPDCMTLMDFSADYLPQAERDPPTFLYAMPLGGDRVFLEETSLVARPPIALSMCEERLQRRLEAKGWSVGPAEHIERCFIPMGGPLPPRPQRVVPFGGAAAAVHPATGYMIANVLRTAPRLAEAVMEVRDQREAVQWSNAAWSAVWSDDRRRAWMLYRYGMEVLVTLDVSSTANFFDSFFKLPDHHWKAYLSGDVTSGQVASAMWTLFTNASSRLRWQLMSRGFYALMPKASA